MNNKILEQTYNLLKSKIEKPYTLHFTMFDILISDTTNNKNETNSEIIYRITQYNKDKIMLKKEKTYLTYNQKLLYKFLVQLLQINQIKLNFDQSIITNLKNEQKIINNSDYKNITYQIGKCRDLNEIYYSLFDPLSKDTKKGILIYHNEELIGVMNMIPLRYSDEEYHDNILSFKLDENKVPLEKLRIYNSSEELSNIIENNINTNKIRHTGMFPKIFKPKWTRINIIGNLPLNLKHKRYLFSKSKISEMTELEQTTQKENPNRKTNQITGKINKFRYQTDLGFIKTLINRISKEYNQNKDIRKFDLEIKL